MFVELLQITESRVFKMVALAMCTKVERVVEIGRVERDCSSYENNLSFIDELYGSPGMAECAIIFNGMAVKAFFLGEMAAPLHVI